MIQCRKCGFVPENESMTELHHKVPRSIGGIDEDGRVYLCKKCHDIWHNMVPKFIFKFVPEDKKENCRKYIKHMCDWWVNKK